jgi:hypothetical protein
MSKSYDSLSEGFAHIGLGCRAGIGDVFNVKSIHQEDLSWGKLTGKAESGKLGDYRAGLIRAEKDSVTLRIPFLFSFKEVLEVLRGSGAPSISTPTRERQLTVECRI